MEILPHRLNQLGSPPLFPVNGEPFLSRQNRRSGLTETTASFAAPGLPKLKKRVYVLLRKEFLCFLLLAIPGRCSLRYINVCAQPGKNASDWGGGGEMKKAAPHSGFFCLPLNAFTSSSSFLVTAGKDVNRSQAQLKITLPMSCAEPAPLIYRFLTPNSKVSCPSALRSQPKFAYRLVTQDTHRIRFFHFIESSALANRWCRIVSYLMELTTRGRQIPLWCHCWLMPLKPR